MEFENKNKSYCETNEHACQTFPGTITDDMESHIIPLVKRDPDYLILHCGINDFKKTQCNRKRVSNVI